MRLSFLPLAVLLLPAAAWAGSPPSTPPGLQDSIRFHQAPERLELPALDMDRVRAEDAKARERGEPPSYARAIDVAPVTPETDGTWETLSDGSRVWRFQVSAEGATSVEPAFTEFRLPEGAALYVHGFDGKRVRGPYTSEHNARHGELWVPVVEGDRATIELVLEPGVSRDAVRLSMTRVLHGYEAFWKQPVGTKETNSCNVDVACKQAEPWEDQVASVARITIAIDNKVGLCSGQMINDTAFSGRPLFLTANHCEIRESNAASLTAYWNFEHPECRDISDTRKPLTPRSEQASLDQAQSGARLLANFRSTDFTLVELSRMPKPEWDVFWTGWDRRDMTFDEAVGIHHPQGDAKRISFENDPLDIVDGSDPGLQGLPRFDASDARPRSHFRVNDWDLGVTEGGSSGSGLWNGDRLLVGQLHGGTQHQCDDNDLDYYGRFWLSWEGGATADSSLEPWLDPLGTGGKQLKGRDGDCRAPGASIADLPANVTAGDTVTLKAKGGNADVRFLWDVDGDGIIDAEGRQAHVRFTEAGEREIRLTASNPGGLCGKTVSKTVTVQSADLELVNVLPPEEVRGDGDDVLEPGERWFVRVSIGNAGNAPATDPRAVFARPGANLESAGPDDFGYTATSSRISGACRYQFEDIRAGSNRVDFTATNPDFPPKDDGGSEAFDMGDFNFNFYGSGVAAMVMSSNGYLAPSAGRNGGDFSNDCPLPARADPDPGVDKIAGHARLAAYHDDLVTNDAFQKRFDDCPRPGDVRGGSGACWIFQWNNVDVLPAESPYDPLPLAKFDFQAILYEGTGEVVYQYGPDAPAELSTPTVGIQNNQATRGLTWGCDGMGGTQPPLRPDADSAVCFYHPKNKPSEPLEQRVVRLVNPVLDYEDLEPDEFGTSRLDFEIDEEAPCGAEIAISLQGINFDGGFSQGPGNIFTARVGGEDAECDADTSSASAKADIDFLPGMYFNPARAGHGVDIHTAGDTAFLVWFTYGTDRQPVWYLAQGDYQDNQIVADLLRFTDGNIDDPKVAGQVVVTFLDETRALFNWTLDGKAGGEPFEYLKASDPVSVKQPTGHWFPPKQAGWGMTFNAQDETEFAVVYFYDEQGQPVWALGQKASTAGKIIDLDHFKGVCPGCDWTAQSGQSAGELVRDFIDAGNGTVETDITLQPPLEGSWLREPVDIEILSDPVE
jgi:PKD repeat protein